MYGGVISSVPETATAYAHRSDFLNFQFYGGTPNGNGNFPSSGITFMNGLVSSLAPNPTGACEFRLAGRLPAMELTQLPNADPNYIDPTLTAAQWQSQYFGGNFARLTQLKKAWDPSNVFKFPQSIPVAA